MSKEKESKTMPCPKCGSEVWLATCQIPGTKKMRNLHACKNPECNYRRQPCETYSRVVGYLRPVDGWNEAKTEEFKDRKTYKVDLDSNGNIKPSA